MNHTQSIVAKSLGSCLWTMMAALGCTLDADLGSSMSATTGSTQDPTAAEVSTNALTGQQTPSANTSTTQGAGSSEGVFTGTTEGGLLCDFGAPCDIYAQDACGAGSRCIPWYSGDTYTTVCGPALETPMARFEACTIDAATCSDSCAAGDYCAHLDELGNGICLQLCTVGETAPCDQGSVCDLCPDCDLGTCHELCNPLAPACSGETSCQPVASRFSCTPIPEGNTPFEQPCSSPFECTPGLFCIDESMVAGCEGLGACCTQLCDIDGPATPCTDPAHVCVPYYWPEPGPPGQEDLGMCALPEFDPCNTPGNCAPPGVEPNVPWCSSTNTAGCPGGDLAGFGTLECEEGCVCSIPCEPGSCPIPTTGTATGTCVEEPFGVGSLTSCMYSCAAGELCPDGMSCRDELGEFLCVWISEPNPERCE